MPSTYVSALERGVSNVTIATLEKLAHAMNCKLTDLIDDEAARATMTAEAMRTKIKATVDRMPAPRLMKLLELITTVFS